MFKNDRNETTPGKNPQKKDYHKVVKGSSVSLEGSKVSTQMTEEKKRRDKFFSMPSCLNNEPGRSYGQVDKSSLPQSHFF